MSIAQLQQQYEVYRKSQSFQGHPASLYAPMEYIMNLGGKRARPLLTLSSALSSGGDVERALPIAHAMEVFHNFTLLHDDIMDNALIRRGKPTVHVQWNVPSAILSGDNMLVAAFDYISQYQGTGKTEIFQMLIQTAREVCEGQQMDMDFSQKENVSESQYLQMIQLKTAVLLGCCAYCGAITGGHKSEFAQKYYAFALNLGMAFQLHDDWLDTFGDPSKTGKKAGGDIAEGKKTWLYIAAKQRGLNIDAIFSIDHISDRIRQATDLFVSHGLDNELLTLSSLYADKAAENLQKLAEMGEKTGYLNELTEMLGTRQH